MKVYGTYLLTHGYKYLFPHHVLLREHIQNHLQTNKRIRLICKSQEIPKLQALRSSMSNGIVRYSIMPVDKAFRTQWWTTMTASAPIMTFFKCNSFLQHSRQSSGQWMLYLDNSSHLVPGVRKIMIIRPNWVLIEIIF